METPEPTPSPIELLEEDIGLPPEPEIPGDTTKIIKGPGGGMILQQESTRPKNDWLDDTPEESIIPPPPIIEGLLAQAEMMVLGAGSKSYKTWALLDLAISLSHGVQWWGRKCAQQKTLFLNMELGRAQCLLRAHAIRKAKGLNDFNRSLAMWHLTGQSAPMEELCANLRAAVTEDGFTTILIDPIYLALKGADENDAGAISSLLDQLSKLKEQHGCTIIYSHHFSKGNQASKEAIDRLSGSGAFARIPATIMSMTKHADDQAFVIDTTLRSYNTVNPWVVRWEHPLLVRDDKADPYDLKTITPKKRAGGPVKAAPAPVDTKPLKVEADEILHLLEPGITLKEWCEFSQKKFKISERTFYRRYADLDEAGLVSHDHKTGEIWPAKDGIPLRYGGLNRTAENNTKAENTDLD